ncbi:MAG: protease modulator HflC [Deltaproteobacteria bacterium]|jgi:membrane protease subunit HflC|nr:protease modulator HflC [Deltaproteobacteria bacterium]
MEKRIITLLVIIGILGVLGSQSLFTVHQTERAIVLQLGEPMGSIADPGLHFKLPFIQNVVYLDKRILTYDASRASAYTSDNKNIVLDNFMRWRIKDSQPETSEAQDNSLRFYQTLRTTSRAQDRLGDIVNSELRVVIGRYTLSEVITTERQKIMLEVIERANLLTEEYGIEVVDVRIKRADLPDANQVAVFDRMRAERVRLATQYRSEGVEEATKIRSLAELEQTKILAEARNKAQVIMGDGDANSTRIFAEALSQSPEFYDFSRSLETYRKSLKENTRLLLPLGEEYLKYFN